MYFFDTNMDKDNPKSYAVAVEKNKKTIPIYIHKKKNDNKTMVKKSRYNFKYTDYDLLFKNNGIRGKQKAVILKQLEDMYFDNITTDDEKMQSIYEEVKKQEDGKSLYQSDYKLIPVPRPNWFNVFYISGSSGSGKTKLLVNIVNEYLSLPHTKDMYRKQKRNTGEYPSIYLISEKNKDAMIDDNLKNVIRLDVNSFIDDPITLDEFGQNDILIFDDYEGFKKTNIKIYNSIQSLLMKCMNLGRTKHLQVFIIRHDPTAGTDTKDLLREATHLILYPESLSYHSMKYIGHQYLGLDTKEINLIKQIPSWVCFHNRKPKYIVTKDKIQLVKDIDK